MHVCMYLHKNVSMHGCVCVFNVLLNLHTVYVLNGDLSTNVSSSYEEELFELRQFNCRMCLV